MIASSQGHENVVKDLLSHNADVNGADKVCCGVSWRCRLFESLPHPVSYTHLTLPTNREV